MYALITDMLFSSLFLDKFTEGIIIVYCCPYTDKRNIIWIAMGVLDNAKLQGLVKYSVSIWSTCNLKNYWIILQMLSVIYVYVGKLQHFVWKRISNNAFIWISCIWSINEDLNWSTQPEDNNHNIKDQIGFIGSNDNLAYYHFHIDNSYQNRFH